jgi:hypothetical protein
LIAGEHRGIDRGEETPRQNQRLIYTALSLGEL